MSSATVLPRTGVPLLKGRVPLLCSAAMALIDKDVARFIGGGLTGAAAVVVAPYVGPVVTAIARPLLKAVIRQGTLGFAAGRVRLARAAETLEDLVAEVRAELEEERRVETAGASMPAAVASTPRTNGSGEGAG